jgi:hypothetical protein
MVRTASKHCQAGKANPLNYSPSFAMKRPQIAALFEMVLAAPLVIANPLPMSGYERKIHVVRRYR